jgi:hypothetical protein
MTLKPPNRRNRWLVCLALWLAALGASGATSAPATAPDPFDQFKIITNRNIFNPTRRRPSRPTPARTTVPAKVDLVTLVGILRYDKGAFAFFDGTNSNYRQVLKPGEAIGGWTVADITSTLVKMKMGERELDLTVGSQLRRVNEGDWKLIKASPPAMVASATRAPSRSTDYRRSDYSGRNQRSGRSDRWDGRGRDRGNNR